MKFNCFFISFSLILTSCAPSSSQNTQNEQINSVNQATQKKDEIPADILLSVYDSLEQLEVQSTRWEEALLKARKYHQYIWHPLEERLNQLAKSAVIQPGEHLTAQRKQERRESHKRYKQLRISLSKIVKAHPTSQGLALLIQHLEQDNPEALIILRENSGKDYGYDIKKWSHWFLAERLKKGTVETRQALDSYLKADLSEQVNILRTWQSICGELKVQSIAESQSSNQIATQKVGKVASRDLEVIRLQALAVFLEALKSSQPSHVGLATVALVQLGEMAEQPMVNLVNTTHDTLQKGRAIAVLGHSSNVEVALEMMRWVNQQGKVRDITLQSLGNLKLDQKESEQVATKLQSLLQEDLSQENVMRTLAALINLGQTERFLLMLEIAPELEDKKILIDSRKVKDFHWLQIRRVAQRAYDRHIEKKHKYLPKWFNSSSQGAFNPVSEFHKYVARHKLDLNKENWHKWFREKLIKIS